MSGKPILTAMALIFKAFETNLYLRARPRMENCSIRSWVRPRNEGIFAASAPMSRPAIAAIVLTETVALALRH